MADLLKASLRMRPDRIIIGEVRGAEAVSMLQALSTGHSGSMSSIHANSCLYANNSIGKIQMYWKYYVMRNNGNFNSISNKKRNCYCNRTR